MSIKAAIIEKNEGEEVEKSEYTNLIMDDMEIKQISEEDRDFLEGFVECQFLSLNSTKLESLTNMPKLEKLERLELCENTLGGPSVGTEIARLYPNLATIKLSQNKIETVEDIAGLKALEKLESLDLSDNPICTTLGEEYQAKVREALSGKLEILDCMNKNGDEVVSDEDESEIDDEDAEGDDDDDDDAEEGEEELDEDEGAEGKEGAAKGGEKGADAAEEPTGEGSADTAAKRAKTADEAPDVPATAAQ